jgi:hypothetical protein
MKGFPFQTAGNRRISVGICPTGLGMEAHNFKTDFRWVKPQLRF